MLFLAKKEGHWSKRDTLPIRVRVELRVDLLSLTALTSREGVHPTGGLGCPVAELDQPATTRPEPGRAHVTPRGPSSIGRVQLQKNHGSNPWCNRPILLHLIHT